MPQSGPNFASSQVDIGGGVNGSPVGGSWTSPGNILADDGVLATWNKPAASVISAPLS